MSPYIRQMERETFPICRLYVVQTHRVQLIATVNELPVNANTKNTAQIYSPSLHVVIGLTLMRWNLH